MENEMEAKIKNIIKMVNEINHSLYDLLDKKEDTRFPVCPPEECCEICERRRNSIPRP